MDAEEGRIVWWWTFSHKFAPQQLALFSLGHTDHRTNSLNPRAWWGRFITVLETTCIQWRLERRWLNKKDKCEISEGKDFFDYNKKVDWIITNPPWSKIKEFLKHSVKISDDIVYLISINHFTTKARLRIIYEESGFGITEIYCFITSTLLCTSFVYNFIKIHYSV